MSVFYPQAVIQLAILWEDRDLKSKADLQQVYKLPILAQEVNVHINDYSQADTFDCTIDYKSFPFDPRLIRSCGVTIHMEDRKKVVNPDGSLSLIEATPDNVIFQGFVDEGSISLSDENRTVKLEGRDFTALLVDQPFLRKTPLDLGKRIDQIIQELLSELKSTQKITVVNRTGVEDSKLPILKSYYHGFGEPLAGHKNMKDKDTYWEVITDIATKAGLVAFIELDKLVISSPRTIYKQTEAVRMIYGRNLKSLDMKRKLGRQKGFNVAVRSLNKATGEVFLVKIPEQATKEFTERTGIAAKETTIPQVSPDGTQGKDKPAPYITFRVNDERSPEKLIEFAEGLYEEMSRQQIEGSYETKEMCAYTNGGNGTNPQEFDLLKMRNGTPIRLTLDSSDMKGLDEINIRYQIPYRNAGNVPARTDEIIKFLVGRCYDPAIAKAIAETFERASPFFYTKQVTFSLSKDNGFSLKSDFINFIELLDRDRPT